MTDNVLSQAEVESLLNAMENERDESSAPNQGEESATQAQDMSGASRRAPEPADASPMAHARVTPYDFKRPERVGKDQMRALQSLHEGFGRNYGAALSGLLRCIAEVKLVSVDQLTYSEFIFSLENPTCFNLLKAKPLEGNLILDINPSILFPIIDRLLGGGKEATAPVRRPLTEIELRLVSRITNLFLSELHDAWENVVELDLSVERVESNPQLVQIVPPNEVVVLISFELTMSDVRGMINLCIPFNSIERISSQLAANSWVTYSHAEATKDTINTVAKRLSGSLVDVVVTLAESKLKTTDLLGLRVGDIVTTEKDVKELLDVHIEGVAKYRGRPGAFKGHKAVRIDRAVEPLKPPRWEGRPPGSAAPPTAGEAAEPVQPT